jgi:hypothetical protein
MADAHVKGMFGESAEALRAASPTTHLADSRVPMLVLSEGQTFDYTHVFQKAAQDVGRNNVTFSHWRDDTHASLFQGLGATGDHRPRSRVVEWIRRVIEEASEASR